MIQHYSVLNAAFYCNTEVFYVCKATNGGLYEEKKTRLRLWMRGGSSRNRTWKDMFPKHDSYYC